MAAGVGTRVLDLGLNVLDTEADRIVICNAEPTTFTEATSTFLLGSKTFAAGAAVGSPTAATPNGRKVSTTAFSDGTVSATGTASWWAVVDFANSRLLAKGQVTPGVAVTSGQTWTFNSVSITIPAAVSGYVYPDSVAPGASMFYGFRAYRSANIGQPCCTIAAQDGTPFSYNIGSDGKVDFSTYTADMAAHGGFERISEMYNLATAVDIRLQSSFGTGPAVLFNAIGTLPGANYDGVDDQMIVNASPPDVNQPWSFSVVGRQDTPATANAAFFTLESPLELYSYNSAGTRKWGIYAGSSVEVTAAQDVFHKAQCRFDGASSFIRVDGTTVTGDCGTNVANSPGTNRAGWDSFNGFQDGVSMEIGVWQGTNAFDSTKAAAMEANQAAYYGI